MTAAAALPAVPPRLIQIDPVALLMRGLARMEGIEEVGGDNRGRAVERIQKRTGNRRGDAWCASLVYDAGNGMLGVHWPLPATASCDVLLEYARKHGLLRSAPEPGDVFLLMRAEHDAIHTGFVTELLADGYRTIEGNTNDDGSANGYCVLRRTRGDKADKALRRGLSYRYIRWHSQ